ncbi:hypothetical protein NKH77_54480 [Streptomyces sp. M19]
MRIDQPLGRGGQLVLLRKRLGPVRQRGRRRLRNCQSSAYHGAWPNASQACWDITRPDLCGENIRGAAAEP